LTRLRKETPFMALDGNHPLSGRTFNFEIRLEEIVTRL